MQPQPSSSIMPQPLEMTFSLYIGNLPEKYTEKDLNAFFLSHCFQPSSIELGKNQTKGRQHAFIKVVSDQAQKIIEQLNYTVIENKEIRVSRCTSYQQRKQIKDDLNIFVKDLPEGVSSRDLHDQIINLAHPAIIESAKVGTTATGKKLTYGYVCFAKNNEAEVAKLVTKGSFMWGDKKVSIFPYHRKTVKSSNLYLKEFPKTWKNEGDIVNWFRSNGSQLEKCFFPIDKNNQLVGFGLATLKSMDDVIKLLSKVTEKEEREIESKFLSDEPNFRTKEHNMYIGRGLTRSERQMQLEKKYRLYKKELKERTRDRNIYINNFPNDYTDDNLKSLFEQFGRITSARVMVDNNGTSKGYGFVCFEYIADARKAIDGMKDYQVGNKKLTVNMAMSKSARKREIEKNKMNQVPYPQFVYPPPMPNSLMQQYQIPQGRIMRPNNIQPFGMIQPRPPMQHYNQPYVPIVPPQQLTPQPMPPPPQRKEQYTQLLSGKSPEEQREALGEIIYGLASEEDTNTAPKITGMLLELDINELLFHLNTDKLKGKINEAREVLRESAAH